MPPVTVSTDNLVFRISPGPHKEGQQFTFTDNLRDGSNLVGRQSGFMIVVREIKDPKDKKKVLGTLLQHQATFDFEADLNGAPGDQITTQGVVFVPPDHDIKPHKFAITGGTGAYAQARGQVTWTHTATTSQATLEIA
jgi:hypothetical protein